LKLQDLPCRLLVMLLERPGEIVSREEVRQRLWPENSFGEFDNSLGVAVRKIRDSLGDNADAPCYVETLPRRGYRFLAPVIPETGSRDLRSETAESAEPELPTIGAKKPLEMHPYLGLGVLVVLLLGGAVYVLRVAQKRTETKAEPNLTPAQVHVRRSVAVMGFRNLPGRPEDNWLSPAFAEMLNTELASDGSVRLMPGEDTARVKRELPDADEDTLAKATLARLKTNFGADLVVLGSYTPLSGTGNKRIRLDVRVQDTARGETIREESFTGSEANLFELASQAGESLRSSLGIAPQSGPEMAQARATLPSNREAIRFYVQGQQRLWAFDNLLARDLLIKAIAADPAYPLAHGALSDAWFRLGYASKARAEAERARALSERLGSEERWLIEGQYYTTLPDTTKAIESYQRLFSRYPDSLYYGLRLADLQRRGNAEDALHTLDLLRRLPSPSGDDPRIDLIESRTWLTRDVAKAQAAGHRGLERAKAQGSPLLVARAYGILCQSQGGNSSPSELLRDCEEARENARAAGDHDGVARATNDLAGIYYLQGHLEQAETMFQEALGIFRKTGDIDGISVAANNLGAISLLKGNLADAALAFSDAIPGYKEEDDKDGVALALNNLGDVARRRGDLKGALRNYEQAKAVANEIDDKSALGYILTGIGDALTDRGELAAAREAYQQALTLRKQTGEKQFVAETEVRFARLSIQDGKAADAESVLRKCKEQFDQDQQADDELESSVVLIEALLDEGNYPGAAREEQEAKLLASNSVNEILRIELSLASARVDGASGQVATARTQLERTLQSAHSHKLLEIELETRLAMGVLKGKSGQLASARAELLALETTARSDGFGLIASKALSFRNISD
jgi:eukaryotic-like serine/threonine-protein kinase